MENLNTHTPAALYQTFTPAQARRILEKLESHHTPLHGSWLNMAEIELSALTRQCLSPRIGTREELDREVQACTRHTVTFVGMTFLLYNRILIFEKSKGFAHSWNRKLE